MGCGRFARHSDEYTGFVGNKRVTVHIGFGVGRAGNNRPSGVQAIRKIIMHSAIQRCALSGGGRSWGVEPSFGVVQRVDAHYALFGAHIQLVIGVTAVVDNPVINGIGRFDYGVVARAFNLWAADKQRIEAVLVELFRPIELIDVGVGLLIRQLCVRVSDEVVLMLVGVGRVGDERAVTVGEVCGAFYGVPVAAIAETVAGKDLLVHGGHDERARFVLTRIRGHKAIDHHGGSGPVIAQAGDLIVGVKQVQLAVIAIDHLGVDGEGVEQLRFLFERAERILAHGHTHDFRVGVGLLGRHIREVHVKDAVDENHRWGPEVSASGFGVAESM